jgi:NADPH:quinone reductase-like Zn-dependent oxidoreductase
MLCCRVGVSRKSCGCPPAARPIDLCNELQRSNALGSFGSHWSKSTVGQDGKNNDHIRRPRRLAVREFLFLAITSDNATVVLPINAMLRRRTSHDGAAAEEMVVKVMKVVDNGSALPKPSSRPLFGKKMSTMRRNNNRDKRAIPASKQQQDVAAVTMDEQRGDDGNHSHGSSGFFSSMPSLFHNRSNSNIDPGRNHADDDEERDMTETGSKSTTASRTSRTSLMSKLFSNSSRASQSQSLLVSSPPLDRMQAKVLYESYGDATVLSVVERESELPDPLPHYVWVKVQVRYVVLRCFVVVVSLSFIYPPLFSIQASSVTLHDCLVRHGVDASIFDPHSLPITPGTDLVGHIVKCHRPDELPNDYSLGDRVCAVVKSGANSRFVQVPIANLLQIVPSSLDAADVAAVISHYTLAYQALRAVTTAQQSRPMLSLQHKNVLLFLYEGMLDGTTQALIQLCKKAQATVYVVAPTSRHAYLRNVLQVLPLPSEDQEWAERIECIDIIFDATAEDDRPAHAEQVKRLSQILQRHRTAACAGGGGRTRVVQYGFAPLLRRPTTDNVWGAPMSLHWRQLVGQYVPSYWWCGGSGDGTTTVILDNAYRRFQHDPARFRQDVHTLLQWLAWNKLSPHVSKRLGLGDIGKWHAALQEANPEIRGALIVLPWRVS